RILGPIGLGAALAGGSFASGRGVVRAAAAGALAHLAVAPARRRRPLVANQPELDAPPVQIDAADLHLQPVADRVADAGALAAQLLARLVVAEVLAAQLGDVQQPAHVQRIERDENAEAGDGADDAAVLLAQVLAHVL